MEYMNVAKAAELWGISDRRVRVLCKEGRIDGVIRQGKAYHTIKVKIKMEVIKYERNHGYSQRCEWCEENVFCDRYQTTPAKKHFWEVRRCSDSHSSR